MQLCTPCRSSWGANGYSEVWLNQSNDYVHRHLHVAGDKMVELANLFPDESKNSLKRKALNQCAREFYLLKVVTGYLLSQMVQWSIMQRKE